jgi:wobble nucleotide-excising tRNase
MHLMHLKPPVIFFSVRTKQMNFSSPLKEFEDVMQACSCDCESRIMDLEKQTIRNQESIAEIKRWAKSINSKAMFNTPVVKRMKVLHPNTPVASNLELLKEKVRYSCSETYSEKGNTATDS